MADSGNGVIVATDMFGGTPSNLAISNLVDGKIEVIAGVNLPMLVKMISDRKKLNLINLLNFHKKQEGNILMLRQLSLRIKKFEVEYQIQKENFRN